MAHNEETSDFLTALFSNCRTVSHFPKLPFEQSIVSTLRSMEVLLYKNTRELIKKLSLSCQRTHFFHLLDLFEANSNKMLYLCLPKQLLDIELSRCLAFKVFLCHKFAQQDL